MKATFSVHVVIEQGGGLHEMLHKSVDLPFAPVVGMDLEDIAWKEARPILAVSLNIMDPDAPTFYVSLGIIECIDKKHAEQIVETHKLAGWRIPTLDDVD